MNPFNLLINYVIANSRASFYNVPGNQEITNTALLTGMVSENPLMSYLIIDNKAKIEGDKITSTIVSVPETPVVEEGPNLPPPSETVVTNPTDTKGNETPTEGNVTLETIRAEISTCNTALTAITTDVANLNLKIATIEGDSQKLNLAVAAIQTKLTEISTKPTPDTITESKNIATQNTPTKNGPK